MKKTVLKVIVLSRKILIFLILSLHSVQARTKICASLYDLYLFASYKSSSIIFKSQNKKCLLSSSTIKTLVKGRFAYAKNNSMPDRSCLLNVLWIIFAVQNVAKLSKGLHCNFTFPFNSPLN